MRADYMCLMPRPFIAIDTSVSDVAKIVLNGLRAAMTTGGFKEMAPTKGDSIDVVPGKLNIIQILQGDDSVDPLITWTMTINTVHIVPRYSVL